MIDRQLGIQDKHQPVLQHITDCKRNGKTNCSFRPSGGASFKSPLFIPDKAVQQPGYISRQVR